MEKRINEIDNLNEYEKIFLVHKIFDIWGEGKIIDEDILFLPSDVKVYNEKNISKVYLICSKINKSDKIENIMKEFMNLNFYEKLDLMIYLFEEVNELTEVPNKITNTMSLKDLSDEIIRYKLNI